VISSDGATGRAASGVVIDNGAPFFPTGHSPFLAFSIARAAMPFLRNHLAVSKIETEQDTLPLLKVTLVLTGSATEFDGL